MEVSKLEPLGRDQIFGLCAMGLAVLVIANDFTALSVALPSIERDFASDVTTVQWVINGYGLVFGVLIVTGGRLADMFGRRRIFFLGTAIFAIFSFIGGLASDVWMLLVARGIMGIGGAMMWPAILGMTYELIPKRAALAGGLILGAAGFGNAVGPLLGGALTDGLSWRWIFFVNVPVAAIAIFVVWQILPDDKPDAARERIDYGGVAALSVGLFSLLLALDLVVDLGWTSPAILGLFAASALSLAGFGFIERYAGKWALIPPDVMANRVFFAAGLATLLMSAIFFAALLYLPQFMSKELGFSAMTSGAGLLPMMGVFALTSFAAGPLYEYVGAKIVVTSGAVCLALGMLLLSRLIETASYWDLVPGMVVLGIGIGLFYSSITTAAITAVAHERASLAGAIVYMFQIAGGAIGLGLNTALVAMAPTLPEGISIAFSVDAGLALCGVIVSALFVGGKLTREQIHALVHRHRAHG